jgi:hypothetical protein
MISSNPKFDEVVKDRFMFHTGGIVFMTLVINGTTIKRLLRTLKLTKESYASTQLFMTAMHGLTKDTIANLDKLRANSFYSYADWEVVLTFMPPFFDLEGEGASSKNMMMKDAYSLKGALEQETKREQKRERSLARLGPSPASQANVPAGAKKLGKARKKSEALRLQLGATVDDSLNKLVIQSISMCERGELNEELISKMCDRFMPEAWLRYFSLVRSSYKHLFDVVPCGHTSMKQLFEAVSCAEDEVANAKFDGCAVNEWGYLAAHVKLPAMLTSTSKQGTGGCFGLMEGIKKRMLQKSLAHAFDISSAFSRVHNEVRGPFMEVLQVILQVETDDMAHVSRRHGTCEYRRHGTCEYRRHGTCE